MALSAQKRLIALSRADVVAFAGLVQESPGPLSAADLAEACARANVPSRAGRADATPEKIHECCACIVPGYAA